MKLTVTGHHVDVTRSMRHYVEDKLARLGRRTESLIGAQVVLSVEKDRHTAEATLAVAGNALHAEVTDPDMYAAIDLLSDKLDRQLIRYKEKHQGHSRDKLRDKVDVAAL